MTSENVKQTYKEFSERNKRLQLKRKYDQKENKKLNEIQDINKEISKLEALKEEKEDEYNEIKLKKLQRFSRIYNNSKLLKEIIDYAKNTTYSHSSLEDIKKIYGHGINEDETDWSLIEKIAFAEEKINSEIQHTNFFNDALNNLGSSIEFPGEEDDD